MREVQTGKPRSFGFSVGAPRPTKGPDTFEWPSWRARPMDAFGRLLWLVAALFGVVLAAPLLDWAAARGPTARQTGKATSRCLRWLDLLLDPLARGSFGILAVAELKIVLRERRAGVADPRLGLAAPGPSLSRDGLIGLRSRAMRCA